MSARSDPMSPASRTSGGGGPRLPARFRAVQPGVVAWLTVLWLVLWGDVTVLLVIGGVLVGTFVCLAFPLPPLRLHLRIRPLALAWLVLRFGYDVVVASVQVSRVVLRRRPPVNAVVRVQLRTPSDFVMAVVGEMLTLVPGSVLVEAIRSTHTLYMHVLDVPDEDAAETFRTSALEQEKRVVRAFGIHLEHLGLPPGEAQRHARDHARMELGEEEQP